MLRLVSKFVCIFSLLMVAPAVGAESSPLTVQPVTGKPFTGQLSLVEADTAQLVSGGQIRSVPLEEMLWWGQLTPPSRRQTVELTDGSQLVAAPAWTLHGSLSYADEMLSIKQTVLANVQIARRQLYALWLEAARDRELFAPIRAEANRYAGDEDRVWLVSGDAFSGSVEAIAEGRLTFAVEGEPLELPLAEVAALRFAGNEAGRQEPAQNRMAVGLSDGTLLMAKSFEFSEKNVTAELVAGLDVRTTRSEAVTYLQPFGQRTIYLSDLEPLDFRHTPYLGGASPAGNWQLGIDRNLFGEPLSAAGRYFLKGLAVHSASRLVYRLPAGATQFACLVALDDSSQQTESGGSAVFRVYVARGGKLEQAYESPTVRSGDPPLPISVDLSGGKAIALVVDYADRGDQSDHADWLDAHFVIGK